MLNREQRIFELRTCSMLVDVHQFHPETGRYTFVASQYTPLSFCGIRGKDRMIGCRHHDDGSLTQVRRRFKRVVNAS
jgi:hypothetical protein